MRDCGSEGIRRTVFRLAIFWGVDHSLSLKSRFWSEVERRPPTTTIDGEAHNIFSEVCDTHDG